ncbi:hypothetical protein LHK_00772 [Laribacter hongkongensis HLHK9]|uniref:Uncharacterized protein n=1 Tax=Laribacter hongkongensis (strain HLHK9) TaxID=557598 RepID=C1D4H1_LARHH|nr:hypothetical protein LHK_00772 [Laribacter hongkongensis HLHK9]
MALMLCGLIKLCKFICFGLCCFLHEVARLFDFHADKK